MSELVINAQFEFPEVNQNESFEWNVKNMMKHVKITFPKKNKTNSRPKIDIFQYRAGYDERG